MNKFELKLECIYRSSNFTCEHPTESEMTWKIH